MQAYKTDAVSKNGKMYLVEYFRDVDMGAPWEEHDGHGIVNKQPRGFIPTENEVRLTGNQYYDIAATRRVAKRDAWGVSETVKLRLNLTDEEVTETAVQADLKHMKAWARNDWFWCGVVVTLLPFEEKRTAKNQSLWGIESDAGDYFNTVIEELINELEA